MRPHVNEVRTALSARLGRHSLRHSVAVAETAADLAEAYGVDPEEAYLAGLLHDWSREETPAELLHAAESAGIGVDDVDRAVPYLLHARVGAWRVRDAFPEVAERIVEAVERHTTAAEAMTELDMVLYIADLLEPGRDVAGLEELRAEVGSASLCELYEKAYAYTVISLIERRKHVHPSTVAAWNAIVEGVARR